MDKADIISKVCDSISSGDQSKGREIINKFYPLNKIEYVTRNYTKADMLTVFLRDQFIDRYSGEKLIFPPVLRIISQTFPSDFPYHSNWKYNECHPAYWDLLSTIDHVTPIARGGTNNMENLVTTSMKRNSAKSNFTLEELNWNLWTPSKNEHWDGKLNWFIRTVDGNPDLLKTSYIRQWFIAVRKTLDYDPRI